MIRSTFILILLSLLTVNLAKAQLEKGSKLIGGTINFNSSSREFDKSKAISLQPTLHYFFTDNLAIGLGLNYGWQQTTTNHPNYFYESIYYNWGVFPELRYYKPLAEKLYLFGGSQLIISRWSNKYRENDSADFEVRDPQIYLSLNLNGGIAYFVTTRVQFEVYNNFLNFQYSKLNDYNSFSMNASLQYISASIRFLF